MILLIRLRTLEGAGWKRGVTNAKKVLARTCRHWCPIVCDLHRFFIAIARAVVNDYGKGGTAPDPIEWCAAAISKRRRVVEAVREFAMLPRPEVIWAGGWQGCPTIEVSAYDVGCWVFSVGSLVKVHCFSWRPALAFRGS